MAVSKNGVPSKIISLIKASYLNSELALLHNGKLSDSFITNAGIRPALADSLRHYPGRHHDPVDPA